MSEGVLFTKTVPSVGTFGLRLLRIPADIPLIHDWASRDYAHYWGLRNKSVAEVEAIYREIVRPEHANAYIGLCDGAPAFLMESYRSMDAAIAHHYDAEPSDRGMHVLVAPAERRIPHFTWHVFTTIMDFLFHDAHVRRVVVEPDVRNTKIHALNRRAGFVDQKTIDLPADPAQGLLAKTALLSFCTREQYAAALKEPSNAP